MRDRLRIRLSSIGLAAAAVLAAAAFLVRRRRSSRPETDLGPAAARDKLWVRLRAIGAAAATVLVAALVAVFLVQRHRLSRRRAALSKEQGLGPRVATAAVIRSPGRRTLSLIGEASPFAEVTLYAKVSGYLRPLKADKGDRVRAGQLLAKIESPETDRDYDAAVANAENLRKVAARDRDLLKKRFVSQQEADQAFANADVAAAQARALKVMKGYEELRAPFDGVVTARYADEGALVQNATNAQAGALPVFTVSDVMRLRVFVYLDQADASLVRPGDAAVLSARERPDVQAEGRVARVSGELDPRTRTLLTEVDLINPNGRFVPGSFLRVALTVPAPIYMRIPVEALIVSGQETSAAVVGGDGILRDRRIRIGDNDGVGVQVIDGLAEGERVALDVGESVKDGTRVQAGGEAEPRAEPPQSGAEVAGSSATRTQP
jgi:RND family efflux transporter MFP subunit